MGELKTLSAIGDNLIEAVKNYNRGWGMRACLILTQIASDKRIPRSCIGYVDDLHKNGISRKVRADRLEQLRKYTPELIEELESILMF